MSKNDLLTEGNLLTLVPMADYKAPDLPRLGEAKLEFLKQIPSRWKNKAMIAAVGLSLLSAVPLSGCNVHHGGAGASPMYVVHLTEQEALAMIRNELEAVGLNFENETPPYTIERWGGLRWRHEIGLDLFDEEKNVAITFINMYDDATSSVDWDNGGGGGSHRWRTEHIATEFAEEYPEITFGVFYNPSRGREWRHRDRARPHTTEEIEILTERLDNQIQTFIEQLREKGIIE